MKHLDLGDLGAFARVYRSTAGLVRGTLARLGVRDAALDDATQDVFVVAYRRRGEFDADRPLEAWLVGIARKIAFRYRRSSARGQRKLAALQWASPTHDPDRSAATIDARRFLEQFLGELREERREVFVLGELYGLTGPEIAGRLGIPVDTAYTRLRAARKQLEQTLLAGPPDDSSPVALHSGWLLLMPRLTDPAPAGGWLLAAVLRNKVAAALLAGTTVVAVPVLVMSTPPEVAPSRPVVSRAPQVESPRASVAAPIVMAPPPPESRLERTLAAPPSAPARPQTTVSDAADPLGAAALAEALAALTADDAAGALTRLDRHAREFPDSALAQARSVARVRALCRLERIAEARAEAGRLAGDDGLVREALAGTCVGEK